jgi:hypothetical protein
MKTTSSILAGAVAAVVIASSPLTFAQTASSAPENNKTDANESNGSMGAATPSATIATPTSNRKADQLVDRSASSSMAPVNTSNTEPNANNPAMASDSEMSKSNPSATTTAGTEKTKTDEANNRAANDQSPKTSLSSEKTKADEPSTATGNDQSAQTALSSQKTKADQNPALAEKTHRTSTVTDVEKKQKEDKAVSKLDKKPAPSNSDKVAKTSPNNSTQSSATEKAAIKDTTP